MNMLLNMLSAMRAGLMGVAIISVIFYHLYCFVHGVPALRMFKWGFIGVDVFMFASAFGLCFSYEKNSLSVFYVNRFKRIFPLLIFHAAIGAALGYFYSEHSIRFAVKSFLVKSTTLYYFLPGFNHGNWFIPAIVLLYLIFPLTFKIMGSLKHRGVVLLSIICLLLSWKVSPNIGWYYDCLMTRIPIFLLGVLAFLVVKGKAQINATDVLCWFGIWVISLSFSNSRFFVAAMFCPIFMIAAGLLLTFPLCDTVFRWCGTRSLELFLGHAFGAGVARAMLDVDYRRGFGALAIMVVAMFAGCMLYLGASKFIKKYLM